MELSSLIIFGATLGSLLTAVNSALAQSTGFTYQGRLNNGGSPANGSYDLTFALFSTNSGASKVGGTLTNTATAVSNGLFTVTLDFGSQFPGQNRWLEIGVRTNGGGAFATLSPRQPLTPSPYAVTAGNVTGPINGGLITAGTVTSTQLGSDVGQWLVNGASVYRYSGKVGILTTNPLASLHVADFQNITFGTPAMIVGIANSEHLELDKGGLQAGSGFPAVSFPSPLYLNSQGGSVEVGAGLNVGGNATMQGNLTVPSGNVGVGTTTPTAVVEVRSATTADILATGHGSIGQFTGQRANGTPAAPTALQTGNELAWFSGRGYTGAGFSGSRAAMIMTASENWTSSANGAEIAFGTTPNGSSTRAERMRITQSGNVGIGTSFPSPTSKLEVSGGPGATAILVTSGGGAASFAEFVGQTSGEL